MVNREHVARVRIGNGMDEKQGKGIPDAKSNERISRSRLVAKKKEFAREYGNLKLQEELLEKSVNSAILNLKSDASLGHRLGEELLHISESRQRELEPLVNSTVNIIRELRFAKDLLSDPSAVRGLNVEEFKSRLLRLARNMEKFEGRNRLEELKAQETKMESELNEFERKISAPPKSAAVPVRRAMVGGKMSKTSNEAIDDFGKLVCRTGHTGNWSEQDHALFLKVRKRCDTIPLLVSELRQKCPDLTTEQIVNHEAWYKRYSKLRDERRQRIEAWKRKKERDQREEEEEAEATPSPVEQRREVVENASKVEPRCAKGNTREKMREERRRVAEKKRRMIEEWRSKKQRKKRADEEQRKRQEEQRAEGEKRRRKEERDKARIKLEEYREEKKKISSEDRSKSDPNLTGVRTVLGKSDGARLVRSFRQQDEEFIRKRLRSLKLSRKDGAETTKLSVAWKSARPRDRSTLLTPTKGWSEKCKREPKTSKTFGEVTFVKDIPKLAISEPGRNTRRLWFEFCKFS